MIRYVRFWPGAEANQKKGYTPETTYLGRRKGRVVELFLKNISPARKTQGFFILLD